MSGARGLPEASASASTAGDLALEVAPFLLGGAFVANVVYLGVPGLAARGVVPLVAWMVLAVPFVFLPLAFYGLLLLRAEPPRASRREWVARLRLQAPSRADWMAALAALIVLGATSAALALLANRLGWAVHPPTMPPPPPLARETLWMVAVWAVYWPCNILGEEIVWRGVLLPRMEARFGRAAWGVNGGLWFVFHLAFGRGNLLVLLPTLALVPYLAQRRRSTWLGVLLHAGLSAPGFVAMALGAV